MHPAIWPQQAWAEKWGLPLLGGELGPHITQLGLCRGLYLHANFILIHPTVWPQYTNITDRQDNSIWQTVLQTVAQKLNQLI